MPDDAAHASNWRRILLTDALIGVAAAVVGLVLGGAWLVLTLLGAAYVAAIGLRARRWARLRREGQGQGR